MDLKRMSFTDNGDGTITDNFTGLMWQKEGGNKSNWYKASGTYHAFKNPSSIDACRSLTLGGHSDWRLPSVEELLSIVVTDIDFVGAQIDTANFPDTKKDLYWTSGEDGSDIAICVNFGLYRDKGSNDDKINDNYLRCVRGSMKPRRYPAFTDNGNGTITDKTTGLMWLQQESPEAMKWDTAQSYFEEVNFGGYSDWRLPTREELESIYPIDTTFFPNPNSSELWTSEPPILYPSYLVGKGECFRKMAVAEIKGLKKHVRCVRREQSESLCNSDVSPTSEPPASNSDTLIVGDEGQVTLPKAAREKLGIKPKSSVVIEVMENGLFIKLRGK